MRTPTVSVAPHLSPDSVAHEKQVQRRAARAWRDGHAPGDAAAGLAAALVGFAPAPAIVAGYHAIGSEIDPADALARWRAAGAVIALPEATPPGSALVFRRWDDGTPLVAGRLGTRHPLGDPMTPSLVLVPLLAFDRRLHRLGYGGGYYDRTLAMLPGVPTIGCAYAGQQVDAVPTGPYDARLDAVATERGIIVAEG